MNETMKISPNEVHLWCTYDEEISVPELLSKYYNLLNSEEKKQQKRFYFQRNRHQYLVTRALVRTVLSQYLHEIRPHELIFKVNRYGKPCVNNLPLPFPLEFNISHSEKLVILAVTNGIQVGVDVEYILRDSKVIPIADRFFSPQEFNELRSLEQDQQYDRFFDLWTLKEAYIKARGMGLSLPLDKFSYSLTDNNTITISFDEKYIIDNSNNWRFWQVKPNETHKISIALTDNKINKYMCSLEIREMIPLAMTKVVDYPIIRTG